MSPFEDINGHVRGIPRIEKGVAGVADDLSRMDDRIATVEQSMPVLIEVQQHLDDAMTGDLVEAISAGA